MSPGLSNVTWVMHEKRKFCVPRFVAHTTAKIKLKSFDSKARGPQSALISDVSNFSWLLSLTGTANSVDLWPPYHQIQKAEPRYRPYHARMNRWNWGQAVVGVKPQKLDGRKYINSALIRVNTGGMIDIPIHHLIFFLFFFRPYFK